MTPCTKDERDALLKEIQTLWASLSGAKKLDLDPDRITRSKKYNILRDEYFARLPHVPVGRCP